MGNIDTKELCGCLINSKNEIRIDLVLEQDAKSDEILKARNYDKKIQRRKELLERLKKYIYLEKIRNKKLRTIKDIITLIDMNIEQYGEYISDQNYYNQMTVEIFNKYKDFKKNGFLNYDLALKSVYCINRSPLKLFGYNKIYKGHWTPAGNKIGYGEFLVNGKCLFLGFWNNDDFYYGLKIYENGSYYIGEFDNFLSNGEGKFYDVNDNIIYEGCFEKDKYHGKGKLIAKLKSPFLCSFSKYKFHFLKNQKSSLRRFSQIFEYKENESDLLDKIEKYIEDHKLVKIKGNFEDNKIIGRGILEVEDYFRYEGEFLNNKFNGYGKIEFLNEEFSSKQYIGEFKNNFINGKGIFSWKSGNYFEGNFDLNEKNGSGIYNIDKDYFLEGFWVNGKINGNCLLNDKENDIFIDNLIFMHGKLLKNNDDNSNENSENEDDYFDDFDLKGFDNIEDMVMSSNIGCEYNLTKDNFVLDYDFPENYKMDIKDEVIIKKDNKKMNSLVKTEKEISMLVK
jgi:hypothetical protein